MGHLSVLYFWHTLFQCFGSGCLLEDGQTLKVFAGGVTGHLRDTPNDMLFYII